MLVMMFFNWKIYRTAKKTTEAIRQGWTKVKGAGDGAVSGMGIHRGGGGATAAALAASATSMTSLAPSTASSIASRKQSAVTTTTGGGSVRASAKLSVNANHHHHPSGTTATRRTSSAGIGAASGLLPTPSTAGPGSAASHLRRQKTIAATGINKKANNASGNGSGAGGPVVARATRGSTSASAQRPSSRNGHRGGSVGVPRSTSGHEVVKAKSKSTANSEEDSDSSDGGAQCRTLLTTSCLTIPLLSTTTETGGGVGGHVGAPPSYRNTGSSRAKSTESLTLTLKVITTHTVPRVSHHQPCQNHIVGKTFAEMGTQTVKEDKGVGTGNGNGANGNSLGVGNHTEPSFNR